MAKTLPDRFIVPTLDALVDVFTKRWRARMLQADPTSAVDVGVNSFPWAAGKAIVDVVFPLFGNVIRAADAYLVRNMRGQRLFDYAAEKGVDGLRPATGSTGYIIPRSIATGGANIEEGTQLFHRATNLRFRVRVTDTYVMGQAIAIEGIDVGPATNLEAGTVLEFVSAPSGVSTLADIEAQNDGFSEFVGLTGGSEAETEEELQDRIIDAQTNPPTQGNSAQVIFEAERTPGVPVAKAWVYPAFAGPGSTCVVFTIRPSTLGAPRTPSSIQMGLVESRLRVIFPTDDSITVATLLDNPVTVAVGVTWRSSSPAWVDAVPWPPSAGANSVAVMAAPAPSNTSARVEAGTTVVNPEVGKTIAVYDATTRTFKKKRIASIITLIAGQRWDLTFDFTNAASDVYALVAGQLLSPYSSSLNLLPAPVLTYVRTLGPGEQTVTLPDPGGRQQRFPFSPDAWSSVITNEGLVSAVKASGGVSDVEVVLPLTPYATPVGVLGVSSYLVRMTDFAVFPQT